MRKKKDNNKGTSNINNILKIFQNKKFGKIRVTLINNEVYFVGKDVVEALGYKKGYSDVLKQQCHEDDYILYDKTHPLTGVEFDIKELGQRGGYIINESALYALIFGSELDTAKDFKHWVTSEVLPTIRKTGGYINNVELMVNTYFSDVPDEQKSLVKGLLVNIEEKQKKIVSLNNENNLLAQKNLEWADRPLINSLVRAYASSIGDFGKAWNNYKKELLYKHSININSRITNHINTTGKKPKTLDMIDDSELANAISVAVSLCRENNVEIDDLLNNKAD